MGGAYIYYIFNKLHVGLTGGGACWRSQRIRTNFMLVSQGEVPTYTTSVTSFTLVRQGRGMWEEPKDTDKLHIGLTGDGVCGTSQRILTSFTLV